MTETQTVDLASWLTAVWDEEERLATDAQEECPSLTWEAEKVYDGVYAIELGPSEHPDNDSYDVGDDTRMPREIARHIERHSPASVLARIAADRKILELHNPTMPSWPTRQEPGCRTCTTAQAWDDRAQQANCATLRLLASPYKGREGWREAWGHE